MTVALKQSVIDINMKKYRDRHEMDKFHELEINAVFCRKSIPGFFYGSIQRCTIGGYPPESIGKFGADTDNWVWPRHTGDFSLFLNLRRPQQ